MFSDGGSAVPMVLCLMTLEGSLDVSWHQVLFSLLTRKLVCATAQWLTLLLMFKNVS